MAMLATLEMTLDCLFIDGMDGKTGSFYKKEFEKVLYSPLEEVITLLESWGDLYLPDHKELLDYLDNYKHHKAIVEVSKYRYDLVEGEQYQFKVRDYTTLLLGVYEDGELVIRRGDGKILASYELYRVVDVKKIFTDLHSIKENQKYSF